MTMVNFKIERGISNTTYHQRCTWGQKFWWIQSVDTKKYIQIHGRWRGDDTFATAIELDLGTYILGTGPEDWGARITFKVNKKSVRVLSNRQKGRAATFNPPYEHIKVQRKTDAVRLQGS